MKTVEDGTFMGMDFVPDMITNDLLGQVVRALKSKTGLSMDACEEYASEASMRILKKHHESPLNIETSLFQYWLTSAFYVFLEERRRKKGFSFISETSTDESGSILDQIPDLSEENPEEKLISRKKMKVIREITGIIENLPKGCNKVLTLHLEKENKLNLSKPHQVLNITQGAFHTRVNRCKSRLKKVLLNMPCFQDYWYLIADRREFQ